MTTCRPPATTPLPFAGQWLVRTILIEPDGASDWRSRFATLVFDAR